MKSLLCKCGRSIIVDDDYFEQLCQSSWSCVSQQVMATINGEPRTMASLILGKPSGLILDHINRNIHDNRKDNLRFVNAAQSAHNTSVRKDNTTGFKGVSFHKATGKYRAYISLKQGGNRGLKHLGTFPTIEQAAIAYNTKAKELFGEFAVLNDV